VETAPATSAYCCPDGGVVPDEPELLPLAGGVVLLPLPLPLLGAASVPLDGAAGALLEGAAGALLAGGEAAGAADWSEEGCLAQAVINSIEAASALRATFVFIDGTPME
jgi:hypothetical protein